MDIRFPVSVSMTAATRFPVAVSMASASIEAPPSPAPVNFVPGWKTTSELAARSARLRELREPLYAELDDLRDARDTEVAYDLCGGSARSLLITAGLIATGFVAAAAAVEYVLKDRKNSDD